MKYISTRGKAPELSFSDAVLTGLASDGGLYLPETWPQVSQSTMLAWRDLSYADLAVEVLSLFATDITSDNLRQIVHKAYGDFGHPAVAPLVQIGDKLWLQELFHGPTLAFKDIAMQLLGPLFEHLLNERDEHVTIVGATSGDTGSAAIEAVRGLDHVKMYMLHPEGRVSEIQRLQMTTVTDDNIHNLAVAGDFDDCQRLVKEMFNDTDFREKHNLSAVNSINWARIAAQVVYYFHAALALGAPEREVAFSVPSGNFGNVFAAYVAKKMGLPISQFIVASNHNDILTRFFATGSMQAEGVAPSLSPSMDIQVSSNFERYLFELTGRSSDTINVWMDEFKKTGEFTVATELHQHALTSFSAFKLTDEETKAEIKYIHDECNYVIDPHSAIGTAAARAVRTSTDTPMVVVATAHPAKFPDAVEAACGVRPSLPRRVAHITEGAEKFQSVPATLSEIQALING